MRPGQHFKSVKAFAHFWKGILKVKMWNFKHSEYALWHSQASFSRQGISFTACLRNYKRDDKYSCNKYLLDTLMIPLAHAFLLPFLALFCYIIFAGSQDCYPFTALTSVLLVISCNEFYVMIEFYFIPAFFHYGSQRKLNFLKRAYNRPNNFKFFHCYRWSLGPYWLSGFSST